MTNKELYHNYLKKLGDAGANPKVIKAVSDLYDALVQDEEELSGAIALERYYGLEDEVEKYRERKRTTK